MTTHFSLGAPSTTSISWALIPSDSEGAWFQCSCQHSNGAGHYFMAYIRSGDSVPMMCNAHAAEVQAQHDVAL